MLFTTEKFIFDGRPVSSQFLLKGFWFGYDLQTSICWLLLSHLRDENAISAIDIPIVAFSTQTGEDKRFTSILSFMERLSEFNGNKISDRFEDRPPFHWKPIVKNVSVVGFKRFYTDAHQTLSFSFKIFAQLLSQCQGLKSTSFREMWCPK